jgi:hypothetical protein
MKPITALAVLALIFAHQASAKDKRQDAIGDVRAAQQDAKQKEEDDANAKREAVNTQRYWLRYANRRVDWRDSEEVVRRVARFLISPFGVAEAPAPDGVLRPAYHDLADCEREREIREKAEPPAPSNWTCVPISITFKTDTAGGAINAEQQTYPRPRNQQQQPQQEQEPYVLLYGNYLQRPTGGSAILAPHFLINFSTIAPYYNRIRFFEVTTSGITIIRTVRRPDPK